MEPRQRMFVDPNPLSADLVKKDGFRLVYLFDGLHRDKVVIVSYGLYPVEMLIQDNGSGIGIAHLPPFPAEGLQLLTFRDTSGNSPDLWVHLIVSGGPSASLSELQPPG